MFPWEFGAASASIDDEERRQAVDCSKLPSAEVGAGRWGQVDSSLGLVLLKSSRSRPMSFQIPYSDLNISLFAQSTDRT